MASVAVTVEAVRVASGRGPNGWRERTSERLALRRMALSLRANNETATQVLDQIRTSRPYIP